MILLVTPGKQLEHPLLMLSEPDMAAPCQAMTATELLLAVSSSVNLHAERPMRFGLHSRNRLRS